MCRNVAREREALNKYFGVLDRRGSGGYCYPLLLSRAPAEMFEHPGHVWLIRKQLKPNEACSRAVLLPVFGTNNLFFSLPLDFASIDRMDNQYNNGIAISQTHNRGEMDYLCADCGAKNEIRPREPIRCKECGHRIMYKKRTTRSEYAFYVTRPRIDVSSAQGDRSDQRCHQEKYFDVSHVQYMAKSSSAAGFHLTCLTKIHFDVPSLVHSLPIPDKVHDALDDWLTCLDLWTSFNLAAGCVMIPAWRIYLVSDHRITNEFQTFYGFSPSS
ncbi:DNA directed RNA polymerase, 7 kDa subunit domain-containing protein [Rhizoctonia solani AG-1 IA]|uniref:DNA directed RNA polymerase, 7 kDa subunit domain-containing protein n=1 Tax=Thanatephorus cucumeris (strain AG1-IA) TaxID=983506 RepID=L8WUZ8_THACA|nr:DNA directed RNA polymerase, 7 kDa subunit domain-containing protein [Rhizoctonia solani AG-1 IA]